MTTIFRSASVLAEMRAGQTLPVIVGPTASGKTEFVSKLADSVDAIEVLSADAFQVYRAMDIGTAKPTPELRRRLPHHFVDLVGPDESFSAGRFAAEATTAIAGIRARGGIPVVCGGSGLYLKALLFGLHPAPPADPKLRAAGLDRTALLARLELLDPVSAERLAAAPLPRIIRAIEMVEATGDRQDVGSVAGAMDGAGATRTLAEIRSGERPAFEGRFDFIPIVLERKELYRRIDERVDEMMRQGFIEEVRSLRERGISADMPSQKAIGYREIHRHLDGEQSLERTVELIKRDTRRYAKRQMTWFRTQLGIGAFGGGRADDFT